MSHNLATILAADVVGYDGLTAVGRDTTADPLSDLEDIFARHTGRRYGRMVNIGGKPLYLTEFSNALEAVGCAVEIQRDFADRSEALPAAAQMRFRIGVMHGDLATESEAETDDDSDSVARLVALAEPGGICISRTIYDDVRFRLKLQYDTKRDPKHATFLCPETRQKWDELNLLELSAVKINRAALLSQSGDVAAMRLAFNEAKDLIRKIKVLVDKNITRVVSGERRR